MKKTLGEKIHELRKSHNMTQDELAEKMSVSAQAVSKWENDLSIPDMPVLIDISDFFNVSLDNLLKEKEKPTTYLPAEKRKNIDEMILRIKVLDSDGTKINVNLPLALIKVMANMDGSFIKCGDNDVFKSIDFNMIIAMIESGLLGKLLEVEVSDGTMVEVVAE